MRRSVDVLMDVQLPPEEFRRVMMRCRMHMPSSASIQGLRTRHAGHRRFVEFNLLLPGRLDGRSVTCDLCDALEDAVRAEFPLSPTSSSMSSQIRGLTGLKHFQRDGVAVVDVLVGDFAHYEVAETGGHNLPPQRNKF
jgi:hypothetical protein